MKKNTDKKKFALKIITPIVLIVIIAGIWLIKANEKDPVAEQPVARSTVSAENTEPKATTNPDFALSASKIDLEQLKSYGLPIIIDFGADSCIPCKEMAPVLKKMNKEWQGKVIVKFVDISKYPRAYIGFPLQTIPTQFFFNANGKPYVPSDPKGMRMQTYTSEETGEHVFTAHQGGLTENQLRAIFKEMGVK